MEPPAQEGGEHERHQGEKNQVSTTHGSDRSEKDRERFGGIARVERDKQDAEAKTEAHYDADDSVPFTDAQPECSDDEGREERS